MKKVLVSYGVGYGRHYDSFDVEDDATDEDIESIAQQLVMDKLDWGFEVEQDG